MQYTDVELRIALRTFRTRGATSLTCRQIAIVDHYRDIQFDKLQSINDAIAFAEYMEYTPLNNIEVWYVEHPEDAPCEFGGYLRRGWYYWHCMHGYLSNDTPRGPYLSEQGATIAAYVEQYEQEVAP